MKIKKIINKIRQRFFGNVCLIVGGRKYRGIRITIDEQEIKETRENWEKLKSLFGNFQELR